MDAGERRNADFWLSEQDKRAEEAWTRELAAALPDVKCPACYSEIQRTGGVVSTCDIYPACEDRLF